MPVFVSQIKKIKDYKRMSVCPFILFYLFLSVYLQALTWANFLLYQYNAILIIGQSVGVRSSGGDNQHPPQRSQII